MLNPPFPNSAHLPPDHLSPPGASGVFLGLFLEMPFFSKDSISTGSGSSKDGANRTDSTWCNNSYKGFISVLNFAS